MHLQCWMEAMLSIREMDSLHPRKMASDVTLKAGNPPAVGLPEVNRGKI